VKRGVAYQAFDVPDKFEIEWNGQIVSTGYVGHSDFDNQLLNAGISPSEINTGNPSTGSGALVFNKNLASPAIGILRITSPLQNSDWSIDGKCPAGGTTASLVEVGEGSCGTTPTTWVDVYIDHPTPTTYVPANGDIIYTDALLTTPLDGKGLTHRMRVSDPPFQTILNYEFTISALGVVGNVVICTGINPPIGVVTSSSNGCTSCWQVQVDVPVGESRRVKIIGTFHAPAGSYAGILCAGPNQVTVDVDEIISATKSYTFGVDADNSGTPTGTSTIVVEVRDGTTDQFIDQQNFERAHGNFSC